MANPLPLFDLGVPITPELPRCRMCVRPARWIRTLDGRGEWGMYCAGRNCSNRERLCQVCDKTFVMGVGGAGTKYCSVACKDAGYHPTRTNPARIHECAWCGKRADYEHIRKTSIGNWPYICNPCIAPIRHVVDRLKMHHVTHERARQLVLDPSCDVCGTDLLVKIKERSHSQPKALLVVDHDHNCCPVSKPSCGQCIRGFLCRDCNTAAGLLAENPKRARALGDYIEAWINQ